MPYTAGSFTAGEQPTTSKWNTLWNNDASFADGTGISNSVITASKLATGAAVATVATAETTTSTSYTSLATTTDQVTVTIGANGLALVALLSSMADTITLALVWVSVDISGASTVAASDTNALEFQNATANGTVQLGTSYLVTGLTPGSTTFKMKYRVQTGGSGAGTCTFSNRRITVVPL